MSSSIADPNLVTTCDLHGQEYLVKLSVSNTDYLELIVTNKQTGEEWQCSYDHLFIENVTHKTGNYKQFNIFVTMLKSGLLKTSPCISLDLLTYDDLEALRIRKLKTNSCKALNGSQSSNRRYLIVTYTVEFDRIHYPLPLEYCGSPDPVILQATIKKLEADLADARETIETNAANKDTQRLKNRVNELEKENANLKCEVRHLKKRNQHERTAVANNDAICMADMQRAIDRLERSVCSERRSHELVVAKLRKETLHLHDELEALRKNERALKARLQKLLDKQNNSADTFRTMYRAPKNESRKRIRRRAATHLLPTIGADSAYLRRAAMRNRSMSPRETRSEGDWPSTTENRCSCYGSFRSPATTASPSARGDRSVQSPSTAHRNRRAYQGQQLPSLAATGATNRKDNDAAVRKNRAESKTEKGIQNKHKLRRDSKLRLSPSSSRTASPSPPFSSITSSAARDPTKMREMVRTSEVDFKKLEERMQLLQKLFNT